MIKFVGHNANVNNQREVKVLDIHSLILTNYDKPPVPVSVIGQDINQEAGRVDRDAQEENQKQEEAKKINFILDSYNDKKISVEEMRKLLGDKPQNNNKPDDKLTEQSFQNYVKKMERKRNAS